MGVQYLPNVVRREVIARDNFTKAVIELLKSRVAHHCSNPDCRVATVAASSTGKTNTIGIAAHIHAASSGGPRNNTRMSPDERKHFDNGIWLCSNCATDIDKDPNLYPAELLREWKSKSENTARMELGKKHPHKDDAIETLTTALTGQPKRYISTAISNIHDASSKTLESLDPRFNIYTSHDMNGTCIKIHAKEDVHLLMNINNEIAKEFSAKFQGMVEHGQDLSIRAEGIKIEGSKLFDEIFNNESGHLLVSGKRVKAIQKLWAVEPNTNITESFDDVHGEVSIGTKTFSFSGTACNELFKFSYRAPLELNVNKMDINMALSMAERWEGFNIKDIPYFEKVFSFYTKLANGWVFYTSLEFNGLRCFSSNGMKIDSWHHISEVCNFLNYINRCRIISGKIATDTPFYSEISFNAEEHKKIAESVEIFEGKKTYQVEEITSNFTFSLKVEANFNNIRLISNIIEPTEFRVSEEQSEELMIFGRKITLPRKHWIVSNVIPKIEDDISTLREGDEIKVEMIPQKGFLARLCYEGFES